MLWGIGRDWGSGGEIGMGLGDAGGGDWDVGSIEECWGGLGYWRDWEGLEY